MYLLALQRAKNRIELKKAEAGCGRSQVSSDQACGVLSMCVLESRRVFAALRLGFTQHTDTYNTISEDSSS